ncbi:tetratricopeptide repeat-containing diguanylate cyclase [Spirochaeta isovalerica]|uniref:diguanylate cyclase n=1 Tax=Spirochaeta isovalerica TaxID=150 RepID=A0A841R8B3_9SPIO|nr:tetratricopeptide repeat-containing diguanylate cyclase [Spirochaeta isovalerica]MBB6479601.1 diguanylate cyclase (GGDEF)-like protein [Spirochaeta isovalerica]
MRAVGVKEEEKRLYPFIEELTGQWDGGIRIADIRTLYPESMTRSIKTALQEKYSQFFDYDLSQPESFAFFPLTSLLVESEKRMNGLISRTVKSSAEMYELHRKLFLSLLKCEAIEREELILQEEINYETRIIIGEISYLLEILTEKEPVVLLCSHLPYLQFSSMKLLQEVVETNRKINLLIIFLSEEGYLLSSQKRIQEISDFRMFIEDKGFTFRRIKESVSDSPAPSLRWHKDEDETVRILHNALEMLALDDVEEAIELFQSRFSEEKALLDEKSVLEFDFLKANLNYLKQNWDMALLEFNELKERTGSDDLIFFRILLFLAASYIRKNCFVEARQTCEELDDYRIMHENRRGVFYLAHIKLLIDKQEQAMNVDLWDSELEKIEKMGLALGYKNTVAYWLTAPYELNYLYRKDTIFDCQNRAVKLAEELGNEFRLAALYHTESLYYLWQRSEEGFAKALELLDRSESIRVKLNHKRELVNLFNGRGFLYYQYGEYKSAIREFENAINLINELNDDIELSLSLFNIARTYFTTGMFNEAGVILDGILLQLELLGENTIPLQSPLEIYSIQLITNSYSNNRFKGEELKVKIQNAWSAREKKRDIEVFLYYWAMGVCSYAFNDFQKAEENLEKALSLGRNAVSNSMIPSYFPALLEYCLRLSIYSEKKKAEMRKEGITSISENQKEYFPAFYNETSEEPVLPLISIDMEQILLKTRKNQEINSLHKRIKNIDFLNSFFSLVSESETKTELFRRSFNILENHFMITDSVFIRRDGEEWVRIGGKEDWFLEVMEKRKLGEILMKRKNTIILPELKMKNSYIVGMPGFNDRKVNRAFLARIPGDKYRSFSDLVPIFEMALKSLFQANRRIQAMDDLSQMAHTDSLTGLYNRKAFWNEIGLELERYQRHENPDKPCLTIIYLDLDNFKFYNDTYGHQAGDKVLQKFADLMKSHFRLTDIISRFGGDEFVIMLPETSEAQAEQIIIRLLQIFRTDFLEELHRTLSIKAIPEEKFLSCSIGIGEYRCLEDQPFDSFMARVDALMYDVKKAGKNGYKRLNGK